MKLIIYSIMCGLLSLVISAMFFNIGGDSKQGGEMIPFLFGAIGFFIPQLYTLNKLYENSKKGTANEIDKNKPKE